MTSSEMVEAYKKCNAKCEKCPIFGKNVSGTIIPLCELLTVMVADCCKELRLAYGLQSK